MFRTEDREREKKHMTVQKRIYNIYYTPMVASKPKPSKCYISRRWNAFFLASNRCYDLALVLASDKVSATINSQVMAKKQKNNNFV